MGELELAGLVLELALVQAQRQVRPRSRPCQCFRTRTPSSPWKYGRTRGRDDVSVW